MGPILTAILQPREPINRARRANTMHAEAEGPALGTARHDSRTAHCDPESVRVRNAGFIRQPLGWISPLPDKSGVPMRRLMEEARQPSRAESSHHGIGSPTTFHPTSGDNLWMH